MRSTPSDTAAELGKSRDGVSRWCQRGAARRAEEPDFTAAAEGLDHAASGAITIEGTPEKVTEFHSVFDRREDLPVPYLTVR